MSWERPLQRSPSSGRRVLPSPGYPRKQSPGNVGCFKNPDAYDEGGEPHEMQPPCVRYRHDSDTKVRRTRKRVDVGDRMNMCDGGADGQSADWSIDPGRRRRRGEICHRTGALLGVFAHISLDAEKAAQLL